MKFRLAVVVTILVIGALAWAGWRALAGSTLLGPTPAVAPAPGIPSAATPAVVEYVHDGDTLFLDDGRKVRLLGINTPEIGKNAECYGDEATAQLRALLPEGTRVWVLADVEPLDQYGRSLLFIYTDDATNVNLELLEVGAAEVEQYSPNLLFSDELHDAEDAARAAELGLWNACR
ncbi:MAG: thermonuclease family protein [Rhodoglobus sp.]